jgi:hypothetical protein
VGQGASPAYESAEELGGRMVIVHDENVPRGITGILAARLQRTMEAAAVVIAVKGESASGSIRCDSGMNALDWLESMAPLFDDFGGHPQAGGFRIPTGTIAELSRRTRKWLEENTHAPVESENITIDAELSHDQIIRLGPEGLDHLLERLEPYGEGFKPITFLTRSVHIHQADLVGKPKNNHLKLLVSLGANKWPALWWDGAERYGTAIRRDTDVDLVYRVDRDRWAGCRRPPIDNPGGFAVHDKPLRPNAPILAVLLILLLSVTSIWGQDPVLYAEDYSSPGSVLQLIISGDPVDNITVSLQDERERTLSRTEGFEWRTPTGRSIPSHCWVFPPQPFRDATTDRQGRSGRAEWHLEKVLNISERVFPEQVIRLSDKMNTLYTDDSERKKWNPGVMDRPDGPRSPGGLPHRPVHHALGPEHADRRLWRQTAVSHA